MANYVDGFVLPVPKKNLAASRRMAREAGKVMRELGALTYVEAVADDVKPGKWTSFPQSVKLKPSEVVVFSYIVYKTRRDRDRIMALGGSFGHLLRSLHGQRLFCFCRPHPCHGDVLAALAKELHDV
jgi:uncharacterized protein YbaA (DUF1428 family)